VELLVAAAGTGVDDAVVVDGLAVGVAIEPLRAFVEDRLVCLAEVKAGDVAYALLATPLRDGPDQVAVGPPGQRAGPRVIIEIRGVERTDAAGVEQECGGVEPLDAREQRVDVQVGVGLPEVRLEQAEGFALPPESALALGVGSDHVRVLPAPDKKPGDEPTRQSPIEGVRAV
jgi:hypothetical protein